MKFWDKSSKHNKITEKFKFTFNQITILLTILFLSQNHDKIANFEWYWRYRMQVWYYSLYLCVRHLSIFFIVCKQNNKTEHICIFIIMENVTETNDHKKRQRRKKKERKQEIIEEIISKFCVNRGSSDILDTDNLVTVFQPVHIRFDG